MQSSDSKQNCEYFKKLIVKEQSGSLTRIEKNALQEHLKYCTNCSAFKTQIQSMRSIIHNWENLEPNPNIKRNLFQAFEQQKSKKVKHSNLLQRLKSLLSYRIPVYQIALLLFMGFGIWYLKNEALPANKKIENVRQLNKELHISSKIPSKIKHHLELISRQKGSTSAKDDSALTKFIVTIM